jgi:hypothetical protein
VNEYLTLLKEDLIQEMSYEHPADDNSVRMYKQTITAFWDMFEHGKSTVTLKCKCGNTIITEDLFATLFLEFGKKFHNTDLGKRENHCALSDMMSHYQGYIGEDWPCTNCNESEENAIRNCLITQYPKILYIVVKRASFDGALVETKVNFPVEDFYPYKSSGQINNSNCDVRYDLVASIYRDSKTHDNGHFYAVCKDDSSGVWHEYDDDQVSLSYFQGNTKRPTIKAEYQRNVDLLVYVQKNPPINQDDTSSVFSGISTTIQQVDSNSTGKISSVTGCDYSTNNNSRGDNMTVCNQ